MSDTSLIFNILAKDRASPTIAKVSGEVRAASIASAASTAIFSAAIASAASWGIALTAAIVPAVGAVGLVPGVMFAAAAAVATLKLGTFGLGAAWKAMGQQAATGGETAHQQAERVAAAQWSVQQATIGLAAAQREANAAQLALTQAHVDAAKHIADLGRELRGAHLDEEGALFAVADAEKALKQARQTGNFSQIQRATLAYEQSLQALDDVRARTADLTEQQKKAAAAGVEGSTEVKNAAQAQADAQQRVIDAQHQLAQAQQSLADATRQTAGAQLAMNQALAALSPNAKALVTTLHELGPAWVGVRKSVQDRFLAGVAGDVRGLSGAYLPVLKTRLGEVGGAFNTAIRQSLGLAQSHQFVDDTNRSLGFAATAADSLARAVTPVINGLWQLVPVAASFLPQLAGGTLSVAQTFERWMVSARESGKLHDWIANALGVLTELWHIGSNVAGIVIAIFTAPGNAAAGGGLLKGLDLATGKMKDFLNSAQGQHDIAMVLGTLRDILGNIAQVLPGVVGQGHAFSGSFSVAGTVVGFLADHTGTLAKALPWLAAGFLLVKGGQVAANYASVARIPLLAAEVVTNWRLNAAIRAQVPALEANTAATLESTASREGSTVAENVGTVSKERGLIALAASKVALVATTIATGAATAAQWLWNVAMDANPIGLVVLAIAALVGAIVLIATKTTWFQDLWSWTWSGVKHIAGAVADWLVGKWNWLVDFVTGLPGRIGRAASGMWDGIKDAFRGAINWIISAWNRLHFSIPSFDVFGFHTPGFDLGLPQIPYLAHGGTVLTAGAAVVGDAGPEVVSLPQGATVTPLSSQGGKMQITINFAGSTDSVYASGFMKLIRQGMITIDAQAVV